MSAAPARFGLAVSVMLGAERLDKRIDALRREVGLWHGGRVWAKGEVGKGAAFYFSLPHGEVSG